MKNDNKEYKENIDLKNLLKNTVQKKRDFSKSSKISLFNAKKYSKKINFIHSKNK